MSLIDLVVRLRISVACVLKMKTGIVHIRQLADLEKGHER